MAYGQTAGSSIGSLLRFIQEQKSQSPMIPPSTETGSPVREVIQEPLKAAEDIGTQKVVSLRPEGIAGGQAEVAPEPLASPGPEKIQGAAMGKISDMNKDDIIGMPGERVDSIIKNDIPGYIARRTQLGWLGMGGGTIETPKINEPPKEAGKSAELKPEINTPGLGTKITPTDTTKGQSITNYNYNYDENKADKTMERVAQEIEKGNRSTAETRARQLEEAKIQATDDADWAAAQADMRWLDAFDAYNASANLPREQQRALYLQMNEAKANADAAKINAAEVKKRQLTANYNPEQFMPSPSPTPTPSPSPGNPQGNNVGQSKPQSSVVSSSTPGLSYRGPSVSIGSPQSGPALNVNQAVKSGGLRIETPKPQPKPQPQQSIAQKIATVIQSSPWGWLFGKR